MSSDEKSAKAMSVRHRLLNRANANDQRFDLLVHRYAIEGLLKRLQKSTFDQSFVLKGAMVFLTWGVDLPRPTRDLDLMGFVKPDTQKLSLIFRQIILTPVEEDGLTFDVDSIKSEQIREENLYSRYNSMP